MGGNQIIKKRGSTSLLDTQLTEAKGTHTHEVRRFFSLFLSLIFFLTFLFSSQLYAWNAMGHMVVANIAYQQLTPTARKKVDQLVKVFQTEYPDFTSYTQTAYWPDALRSQQIFVYTRWHYIDMPLTTDNTDITNAKPDTDNALWAVNQLKNILKSSAVTPVEQARFLVFFTHIVGDLHQPLHTVSLYTADFPTGDRGGNSYTVKYQGQSTNLHSMWDRAFGDFSDSLSANDAATLAKTITATYPISFFSTRAQDLNPQDWAAEGMSNAQTNVYDTSLNQELSVAYVASGKALAQQEAALAGYRLGALLNQLLG